MAVLCAGNLKFPRTKLFLLHYSLYVKGRELNNLNYLIYLKSIIEFYRMHNLINSLSYKKRNKLNHIILVNDWFVMFNSLMSWSAMPST